MVTIEQNEGSLNISYVDKKGEISFKEITTTLNSINTTLRESSTQISFLEKLRSLKAAILKPIN